MGRLVGAPVGADFRSAKINTTLAVLSTSAAQLVLMLMKFGTGILTAQVLGVSGKGAFVLAFYLPGLLSTLGGLSIGPAMIYLLNKGRLRLSDSFTVVVAFALGTSAALLGGFYFALPWLQRTVLADVDPMLSVLAMLSLPVFILTMYVPNVFRAMGRIDWFNAFAILRAAGLFLALLVALLLVDGTIAVAVKAALVAHLLTGVLLLGVLWRISGPVTWPRGGLGSWKEVSSLGLQYHSTQVLSALEYRVDIFILAFFMDAGSIGLYTVAVTIAQLPWNFSNAVATVVFPKISALSADAAALYACRATRVTFAASVLVAAALGLVGRDLIALAYGGEFLPAYWAFVILAPGIVTRIWFRIIGSYIKGIGKPMVVTYVATSTLAINIALNIVFIPRWDMLGAAFASTVSYAFGGIAVLAYFVRTTEFGILDATMVTRSDLGVITNVLRKKVGRNPADPDIHS